jgi:hypothetical protein
MVKCGVLFEVRTGFLNAIYRTVGFKGVNDTSRDKAVCKATTLALTGWDSSPVGTGFFPVPLNANGPAVHKSACPVGTRAL